MAGKYILVIKRLCKLFVTLIGSGVDIQETVYPLIEYGIKATPFAGLYFILPTAIFLFSSSII